MSIIPPNVELVGDIGHFALVRWAGGLWTVYLRHTGALELHRGGDGVTSFRSLDDGWPKVHVSAAVVGDLLCLAWGRGIYDEVYFSRWHMGLMRYDSTPALVTAGTAPALSVYETGKLVLAYVDVSSRHAIKRSADLGASWSAAIVVDDDAPPVTDVDVDVYPESGNRVHWTQVDDEGGI